MSDPILVTTSQAPDAKPIAVNKILTTTPAVIVDVPQYRVPELVFGGSTTVEPGVGEIISPLILCNVTAATEADIYQLRVNLVNQVTEKVRWRETLLNLSAQGVTQFVEIGTGKILSGLVKRTVSDAEIVSLQSIQDITDYFS